MAKIVKTVDVEVPTVGHCYPYYLVSVVIVGNFTLLYRRHYKVAASVGSQPP